MGLYQSESTTKGYMKETILGLVRHVLTTIGGGLVTKGTLDEEMLSQVVGAIIALIGVGWSVWQKRQARKQGAGSGEQGAGTTDNILARESAAKAAERTWMLLAVVGLVLTGCATQNAAGRLLATTAITVDSSMQGWGEYVRSGQASEADEVVVRGLYARYQVCFRAAKEIYQQGAGSTEPFDGAQGRQWEEAAEALRNSRQVLINAVNALMARKH